MAIANETIDERPVSSVFTSGRVFYLVNTTIYYSQVMQGANISYLTKCYQSNDPTSEQLNDILDTDGGTIQINSAVNGIALKESANGIIIFCSNGVWELAGPAGGFKATEFSLRKITDNGCVASQSIVAVKGAYFYWGEGKIHTIQTNEFSVLVEESAIDSTIESFYADIHLVGKEHSTGFYNSFNNTIEWFYGASITETNSDILSSHDKGLTLNLKSGGWFPLEFNSKLVSTPTSEEVLVGGIDLSPIRDDGINYISFTEKTIGNNMTFRIKTGQRDDDTFQDFGINYPTAYVDTGYETLEKPSNSKRSNYVTTHFKQTEENWIDDGLGGFELDKQSGCQMRVQWDWNDTSANGRFSPYQEVYRYRRIYVPTAIGAFNSGETVITTKNKTLGRGKAVSLRFEQEANKDFQLLGYTHQWSIKSRM